jgi:hypothetical protein
MWRPAHGATSRPGPTRPTNGYGRAPGRPGPWIVGPTDEPPAIRLRPSAFDELVDRMQVAGHESEAPAPLTQ